MREFDWYRDEIEAIVLDGKKIAMNKNNRQLCSCEDTMCSDCYFNPSNYKIPCYKDCIAVLRHWADCEHREFSEADKLYVKAIDKLNWFARDKHGRVWGFVERPVKEKDYWNTDDASCTYVTAYTSATFEPLDWEDDEPVHRSEILGEVR